MDTSAKSTFYSIIGFLSLAVGIAVASLVLVQDASANQEPRGARSVYTSHGMTREEIRSTNILYRPSRPGHFYGNTVRRRHWHHR